MDPVTLGAVLLAIISGAAGEAGSRLWDEVCELACRPFHHHRQSGELPEPERLVGSLAALEHAPGDQGRATALAEAVLARADADASFRQALDAWWGRANQALAGQGNVSNTISGGNQHGPVLQGRDFTFTGLTFGSTPPAQPPPARESTNDGQ